jgi:hypothetical protein
MTLTASTARDLADAARDLNKAVGGHLCRVSSADERPAGVVSKLHQATSTAQALEDQLTAAAALEGGWPATPEPPDAAAQLVRDVADPLGELPRSPVPRSELLRRAVESIDAAMAASGLPGLLGEPWELAKGGRSVNAGRTGKIRMESADPIVLTALAAFPVVLAALIGLRRAIAALPEADFALTTPDHQLGIADEAAFQALKLAGLEAIASAEPLPPSENHGGPNDPRG